MQQVKEWALLKNGRIKRVVTSNRSRDYLKQFYGSEFELAELNSLPTEVQEAYEFWNKRP